MSKKSDDCHRGDHDLCDGTNLDSLMGCECLCHDNVVGEEADDA